MELSNLFVTNTKTWSFLANNGIFMKIKFGGKWGGFLAQQLKLLS
jgi:hypothetical protein